MYNSANLYYFTIAYLNFDSINYLVASYFSKRERLRDLLMKNNRMLR